MDCTTCALNIHKFLDKKGAANIKVNFATGDVSFDRSAELAEEKLATGVTDLGYKVKPASASGHVHGHDHDEVTTPFSVPTCSDSGSAFLLPPC